MHPSRYRIIGKCKSYNHKYFCSRCWSYVPSTLSPQSNTWKNGIFNFSLHQGPFYLGAREP